MPHPDDIESFLAGRLVNAMLQLAHRIRTVAAAGLLPFYASSGSPDMHSRCPNYGNEG
jgi:hypothetical protein